MLIDEAKPDGDYAKRNQLNQEELPSFPRSVFRDGISNFRVQVIRVESHKSELSDIAGQGPLPLLCGLMGGVNGSKKYY